MNGYTYTLPPRHAISDSVASIEDTLRAIRREVSNQEAITSPFTTQERASAFIGLQNNLVAALAAFQQEVTQ